MIVDLIASPTLVEAIIELMAGLDWCGISEVSKQIRQEES